MIAPAPPSTGAVSEWQEHHARRLRAAEEQGDTRMAQRLSGFGSWPLVALDTILLVAAQIVLTIPVVIVAIILYVASGHQISGSHSGVTGLQDWLMSPQALAADALATQAAIVLILQLRVVGRGILSWSDLGFGPALRRNPTDAVLLGVVLGIAALILSGIVQALLKHLGLDVSGQEQSFKSVEHASLAAFIPFAVTAAITAPLAEEAFFRAYAFRALATRHSVGAAIAVSAILFGALHLLGGVGWGAVALGVIGAVLAWGYARTGNLLTNVTAHMFNNIVGVIVLYHG